MTKWNWMARWVEVTGAEGVRALQNLEVDNRARVTVDGLRPLLQQLLTPDARRAVLPAMLAARVKLPDLQKAAAAAAKEMWVAWHWSAENPKIHETIRVPPCLWNDSFLYPATVVPQHIFSPGRIDRPAIVRQCVGSVVRIVMRASARSLLVSLPLQSQGATPSCGSGGRRAWT